MNFESFKSDSTCPRPEISAYVDGLLSADDELGFELHLSDCHDCRSEMNEQKRLMFALDDALDPSAEIALPANFARVVVANAESKVEGLRCPVERNRALFVSLALGLLVVFGLGSESASSLGLAGAVVERVYAVAVFFGHVFLDLAVAAAVILRSVCLQIFYKSAVISVLVISSGLLLALFFTRFLRQNRF